MPQIVFHVKDNVDVTRLQVEFEITNDLSNLTQQLDSHNVERVEFYTESD